MSRKRKKKRKYVEIIHKSFGKIVEDDKTIAYVFKDPVLPGDKEPCATLIIPANMLIEVVDKPLRRKKKCKKTKKSKSQRSRRAKKKKTSE